jgi:hypothetical protein
MTVDLSPRPGLSEASARALFGSPGRRGRRAGLPARLDLFPLRRVRGGRGSRFSGTSACAVVGGLFGSSGQRDRRAELPARVAVRVELSARRCVRGGCEPGLSRPPANPLLDRLFVSSHQRDHRARGPAPTGPSDRAAARPGHAAMTVGVFVRRDPRSHGAACGPRSIHPAEPGTAAAVPAGLEPLPGLS